MTRSQAKTTAAARAEHQKPPRARSLAAGGGSNESIHPPTQHNPLESINKDHNEPKKGYSSCMCD